MKLESRFISDQILKLLKMIDLNKNIIQEIDCSLYNNAMIKLCLNGNIRIRFLKNILYDENNTLESFLIQFIGYPILLKINNTYLIGKIYNYKNIQNYFHFYISIANSEKLNDLNINLSESNIIDINNIYILSDSLLEQYEILINSPFGGNEEFIESELMNKIWGKGSSYIVGCIYKSQISSNQIIEEEDEFNKSPSLNIKNGTNLLLTNNIKTNFSSNENIKVSYMQNYINSSNDIIIKIIEPGTVMCNSLIIILSIINKYKIDLIVDFLKK